MPTDDSDYHTFRFYNMVDLETGMCYLLTHSSDSISMVISLDEEGKPLFYEDIDALREEHGYVVE